jgi:hypothetical protein
MIDQARQEAALTYSTWHSHTKGRRSEEGKPYLT